MNRGQRGRALFRRDDDREFFFELVSEAANRWAVWASALCLMDNHYHLLLYDEFGRLSRAMRHIDSVYTQRFNRRYGADGVLMRGRFKSRVIQEETYRLEVFRYIHANPVRAGLVTRAGDYRWSSHRWYLSGEAPAWLRTDLIMEQFGDGEERGDRIDDFVHRRVDVEIESKLSSERWAPILGDVFFREAIRAIVRGDRSLNHDAVPQGRRLAALTVEDVLDGAKKVFGVDRELLVEGRRGRRNVLRLLTLLMCRDHTKATAQEIARIFGVRPGTISVLAMTTRDLMKNDEEVRKSWLKFQRALSEDAKLNN